MDIELAAAGAVAAPPTGGDALALDRREVERWFVRRGVPQFIEGYRTEQSMDTRAAPFIVAWIVVWILQFWLNHPGVGSPLDIAAAAGSVVFAGVAWLAVSRLRGRVIGRRPAEFDLLDIGSFAVLPVLPTLLVDPPSLTHVVAVLNVLGGIGIIYVVVAFGMPEIAAWAVRWLTEQVVHIVTLLARTLPLLLVLVVFLVFAAEIWEAAHALHAGELAAVLLLQLFIAALIVVSSFRPELRRLEDVDDWPAIWSEAARTPAANLVGSLPAEAPDVPRLSWIQRRNLDFLVLINALVQSTFVALLVMAFLVAFGLIVVPGDVQATWIGAPPVVIGQFELLAEPRVVTLELLTVSALLSGTVGLYFTGLALTDANYRAEHFTRVVAEVGSLMSARAVYVAAVRSQQPQVAKPEGEPSGKPEGEPSGKPEGEPSQSGRDPDGSGGVPRLV